MNRKPVELPTLTATKKFRMDFYLVILSRIPSYQFFFEIALHSILFNNLFLCIIDN